MTSGICAKGEQAWSFPLSDVYVNCKKGLKDAAQNTTSSAFIDNWENIRWANGTS